MKKILSSINNFIMNIFYWIGHINKLGEAKEYKRNIKVESITNVEYYINLFKWKEDKPWDWIPWVITICSNKLEDDCDGAAILGQWLLSKINIESDLVILEGDDGNHMICISKDRKYMISNKNFVIINNSNEWEEEILNWSWHKDRYQSLYVW